MYENNQFYSVGKSPNDIIGFNCRQDGSVYQSFLKQHSWLSVKEKAGYSGLKGYFINFQSIGRSYDHRETDVIIEEIPQMFLDLPHLHFAYFTSINMKESGPFTFGELAYRASRRLFNWDMYVYPFPGKDVWRKAGDHKFTREILEKYFPIKDGDTGPAGGFIVSTKENKLIEVSPVDAGFCSWHDANELCEKFSYNGISEWRFPSPEELSSYAAIKRKFLRDNKVYQTTEKIINWSCLQKGDKAVAVVTQENEDEFLPPYTYPMGGTSGGYHKSKHGPWLCDKIEFPVTDWIAVRPVRDLKR